MHHDPLQDHDDQPEEEIIESLSLIANDAQARHELLWLYAAETGDLEAHEELERLDPNIVERLDPLARVVWELAGRPDVADPDVRRELYRTMFDACFLHHQARLSRCASN